MALARRETDPHPYDAAAGDAFDVDFIIEVANMSGIEVQTFPLEGLGGVICHQGERWIVSIPEDAECDHVRWLTMVAVACQNGHDLDEALGIARKMMVWSGLNKDGRVQVCVSSIAAYTAVPVHVVSERMLELDALCCDTMTCGGRFDEELPCYPLSERRAPRVVLIESDELESRSID